MPDAARPAYAGDPLPGEAPLVVPPTVRLYSPTQVALGAFFGGPVGLAYFLRANFAALDKPDEARLTLVGGVVLVIVVAGLALALPPNVPLTPLNIVYVLAGRFVAEKHQMSKEDIEASPKVGFYSNGTVAGRAVLCLLGTVALIAIPALLVA